MGGPWQARLNYKHKGKTKQRDSDSFPYVGKVDFTELAQPHKQTTEREQQVSGGGGGRWGNGNNSNRVATTYYLKCPIFNRKF